MKAYFLRRTLELRGVDAWRERWVGAIIQVVVMLSQEVNRHRPVLCVSSRAIVVNHGTSDEGLGVIVFWLRSMRNDSLSACSQLCIA